MNQIQRHFEIKQIYLNCEENIFHLNEQIVNETLI